MQEKKITGGCLCGAVRYEATASPENVIYCHCRMCQQAVGNVFALFGSFPAGAVRFTSGAPKTYRSSHFAERGFCGECGTPLVFRYLDSDALSVSVGSLDRPEDVRPDGHWGVESQVTWLAIDDDLPRKRTEDNPELVARSSIGRNL